MSTWRTLHDNPDLWPRYFVRERVLTAIRRFFQDRGFHEVETPILMARPPAESYIELFETTLLDRHRKPSKAYLATSPEVFLKKLLVAGIGNCFAVTKSFRNTETGSPMHNPEFTILEWYRVHASYEEIMDDCEELIRFIHTYLQRMSTDYTSKSPTKLMYQGNVVDVAGAWERLSVAESFKTYAHIDFDDFFDMESAVRIAKAKGYTIEANTTWEEIYNQIFLNEVEPHLGHGRPTILYDFPSSLAALAKKKPSDPRFAERFEFYIEGLELGDCYSELTDPHEQEERFKAELEEVKRLGKTTYEYDQDFIEALKVGLPTSGGIAIGVDRLVMLFANAKRIQDVLFFPSEELFG
jgi:lysyl-tRNA synthetase class 2